MKYLLLGGTLLLFACHGRKKENTTEASEPFQALSFIKSQVRDVDTNLYNIKKIVSYQGRSDTSTISREQFRVEADPFLKLPDVASEKLRDDYKEQNIFDETLNRVVLFYTAKDPEASLQREQVLIDPNEGGGQVKTIIFDFYEKQKGGYAQHRNLVWATNDHFVIAESIPGPGGTERIRRTKVIWNDFASVSQ